MNKGTVKIYMDQLANTFEVETRDSLKKGDRVAVASDGTVMKCRGDLEIGIGMVMEEWVPEWTLPVRDEVESE